jgi:signal transduction histidine kinase
MRPIAVRDVQGPAEGRFLAGPAEAESDERFRQLTGMSQRLMEAQEKERTRIARELHDDIGQRMALLAIELESLSQALPRRATDARQRVRQLLERAITIGSDVQAMAHRLHSSKLDCLGLASAATGLCRELSHQHRIDIEFTHQRIPDHLPPAIALALFRVLQEAVMNAVKHARVRRFTVALMGCGDGLALEVADGGVGFDVDTALKGEGLGLTSMQERLALLKGHLSIESSPGGGTTIRARVPLPG